MAVIGRPNERQMGLAAAAFRGAVVVGLVGQEMADGGQEKGAEPPESVAGIPEVALLDDPGEERLGQIDASSAVCPDRRTKA